MRPSPETSVTPDQHKSHLAIAMTRVAFPWRPAYLLHSTALPSTLDLIRSDPEPFRPKLTVRPLPTKICSRTWSRWLLGSFPSAVQRWAAEKSLVDDFSAHRIGLGDLIAPSYQSPKSPLPLPSIAVPA